MSTTTTTTKLSPRETKVRFLLARIAHQNASGVEPSKADLTRGQTTQTRANDYQRIDRLIKLGLVTQAPTTGSCQTYRLVVTTAGHAELEAQG